jgi:hypothetical protein
LARRINLKRRKMVYSNEITNSEGDVIMRLELDDRFDFNQKDMFYLMHKVGLFSAVAGIKRFWIDKKYQKEIVRRDKETDKLYKRYKRFVGE